MAGFDQINTVEIIYKAKNGDKNAQTILVESNVGLVWSIVKRFSSRGYESEDLFQIGCVGLMKAIKKFDASYNVKFSTYAVPMIIGEIKRFIRDDGMVKVSRSLKELSNKARRLREELLKQNGHEPTINEMSEKLDVDSEELVMAIESSYSHESLYNTYNESEANGSMLIERIDNEGYDSETIVTDKIALRQIIDTLKPRDRQIIVLRYFKQKTQVEIAKMLGISQVQVSRIEKRILEELREEIT